MQGGVLQNIHGFVESLREYPLTLKKAAVLCLYAEGLRFAAAFLLALSGVNFGIAPNLIYLAAVLLIARGMDRNELTRILVWRGVPFPVFAGLALMFFGIHIITLELGNLLRMILPVPEDFFDGRFYTPGNVFITIAAGALFPAFTEEIFFRGIIARRFFRSCAARRAIVLSALLFGLSHINPWQAVNAFYAGIFFAWMYRRYKSIWLCMFIHAYHNILVTFMSYPFVELRDSYHNETWRNPLWFDLLGLLLFGVGLLTVITLGKKPAEAVASPVKRKEQGEIEKK